MRRTLFSVFLVSVFVITAFRNSKSKSSSYLVYKIDSVHSYYLVYVKKSDSLYKIVSKKNNSTTCGLIQLNKEYQLKLFSIWNQDIWIGKMNLNPALNLNVTCLGFDDSTSICVERDMGIYDLFSTENLSGLCYLPAKDAP